MQGTKRREIGIYDTATPHKGPGAEMLVADHVLVLQNFARTFCAHEDLLMESGQVDLSGVQHRIQ